MGARRKRIPRDMAPARLIEKHCADILAHPNMLIERSCIQHGTTSVLTHSATVTAVALIAARELRIPVDVGALARSALLHDYFLYDWHVPDPSHRLHGFSHPFSAARNAFRDHAATAHECAIIKSHMFPLTPIPPASREAWLVCLSDKAVATHETVQGFLDRWRKR